MRTPRQAVRAVSTVLIVAGVMMLADAGLTVAWQEPLTALQAKLRQDELGGALDRLAAAGPTALELQALAGLRDDRRRIAFLARSLKRRTRAGAAAGRIRIPSIGLRRVVVDGSDAGDLRRGPGFFDEAPFPGAPGTVAIAGHRTTYGAPFRALDRVERGAAIVVEMPYATFTYRVEGSRIVAPDAIEVIRRVRYDRLVLSACHPLFSASKRIVVFARLERTEPAATRRATRGSFWTDVEKLAGSLQRSRR